MNGGTGTWGGMKITLSRLMVDTVEDWSLVRSPGRARRRRRYGHPQNIRSIEVPKPDAFQFGDQIVMHPETFRKLQYLANASTPKKQGE